jgi:hypothetical protein
MRLIDRILGRRSEPEDEPAHNPHETNDGKPIKQLWRSEWHSDDHGLREYRHHVGQSEYGFHGGLEISVGGGDGPFKWGLARPTKADAEMSAYGMREGWELHDSWREGSYEQPDMSPKQQKNKLLVGESDSGGQRAVVNGNEQSGGIHSTAAEISRGRWQMQDDGQTERMTLIGKGEKGFHFAIYTSYSGMDDPTFRNGVPWSDETYSSIREAEGAASKTISDWDRRNSHEDQGYDIDR